MCNSETPLSLACRTGATSKVSLVGHQYLNHKEDPRPLVAALPDYRTSRFASSDNFVYYFPFIRLSNTDQAPHHPNPSGSIPLRVHLTHMPYMALSPPPRIIGTCPAHHYNVSASPVCLSPYV
jgi:hypothetical protein